MTFSEKSAWVMSVGLAIAGLYYLVSLIMAAQALQAVPAPNAIGLAIGVIILIAIAIFGHAIAAMGHPFDAGENEDERDRLVTWRAGNLSGLILSAVAVISVCAYALLESGPLIFHIIVGGLIVSQLAEYILTIWYYRRGV